MLTPHMRVLVTSMGSTAAQGLARTLAGRHHVVGGDAQARHGGLGLCAEDVVLPRGDDPGWAAAVAAHVTRSHLDLVIPVMEPELVAASTAVDALRAAGARTLVSPPEALARCLSKRRLAEVLAQAGVPQPARLAPASASAFPVFIRPDRSTGSRGAYRIAGRPALDAALRDAAILVVTEVCAGRELSIDAFALPAGRLVHAIARTRDEVRGGLAVRSTVIAAAPWLALVAHATAALGLLGFFNLQLIDTADGPRVHDVNPRLGGAMALSFAAGLDAEAYLGAFLSGAHLPAGGVERVGLQLYRRWENVILA